MSCVADRLQVDAVVGAAGDASHQAVAVQSVALGVSPRRRQGGDIGTSSAASGPGYVGHSLRDLGHVHSHGAARTSGRKIQKYDR